MSDRPQPDQVEYAPERAGGAVADGPDTADPAGEIQLSARARATARARVLAGLVMGSGVVATLGGLDGTGVSSGPWRPF